VTDGKWLLVKASGGFGNRIQSVLTGIVYSQLTGRRMTVDWSDPMYSDEGSNVFFQFFRCPLAHPPEELPTTDSVVPAIWRGHTREPVIAMWPLTGTDNPELRLSRLTIDVASVGYTEDIAVFYAWRHRLGLLRAYHNDWRGETLWSILRRLYREHLTLHPEIVARVDRFKAEHFLGPTVGVHVRHSDHQSDVKATHARLAELLRQHPHLRVFLATDNEDVKRDVEQRYAAVISTPHWYPPRGETIHLSAERPSRFESGVEALVDLYLLAECDWLVLDTMSSFALLAVFLTEAPPERILDVYRPTHAAHRVLWHAGKAGVQLGVLPPSPWLLRKSALLRHLFELNRS
jgi:hypothetical protein